MWSDGFPASVRYINNVRLTFFKSDGEIIDTCVLL